MQKGAKGERAAIAGKDGCMSNTQLEVLSWLDSQVDSP